MNPRVRGMFTIICLMFLLGCAMVNEVPIKQFEALAPLSLTGPTSPIMFRKLVGKIDRGQEIGIVQGGLLCIPQRNIHWKGGGGEVRDEEMADVLRGELTKAGYQVVGDPSSLFEETHEWKAEFLIGGTIRHVAITVCYPNAGFGDFTTGSGEASIEVEWQLFQRRSRSVVFSTTTGGTAKTSRGAGMGSQPFYLAFAQAVRNLLAQKQFVTLVSRSAVITAEKEGTIEIEILVPDEKLTKERSSDLIQHAHGTVVTIPIGSGHGSGFLVSRLGFVLTNAHVVGEGSGLITVELPTGRRLQGEVVRRNKEADVALIKLEKGEYAAAPIGSSELLRVGDAVFAIGTPLHETFSRSVTRGVVSAFRSEEGKRFIQSDVVVHPGSSGGPLLDEGGRVVGLAHSSPVLGGIVGIGLNYFTPIEDVFKALQVEPKVTKVDAQQLIGRSMSTIPTAPTRPAISKQEIEDKLQLIRELRQKGLITEAEAERRRKELLDQVLK